mgnify:CR=1 FL=1
MLMMAHYLKTLGIVCLLSSGLVQADADVYGQQCAACHGPAGGGNQAMQAPAIAGLDKVYLSRQLTHFKTGVRGNNPGDTSGMMMAAMAKPLTEAQINRLATYLASQPFISAKPPAETGGFMGRGLYRNCGSCHGAQAQGEPQMNTPRLAGQHSWYLLAQLKKFKSGLRGKHVKDKYGKQMHLVSQGLDFDNLLPSILAHISHLKVTTPNKAQSTSTH